MKHKSFKPDTSFSTGIRLRFIFFVCISLLSTFFLSGCSSQPQEQSTIRIGGVFHLTGDGSFFGNGELNGAFLAIEDLNQKGGIRGVPLELVVEDSKTDFSSTVSSINKLVEQESIYFIVGPTWFGQVASPIALEKKVIIISPSAGVVPVSNDFFFDLWPTEDEEIKPIVRYMARNNIRTVDVIYSENDWSKSMFTHFVAMAKQNNITVIQSYATSVNEQDFRTILLEIEKDNVDAVYAPFAFFTSQGLFSRQWKTANMIIPLFSSSNTENPDFLKQFPEIESTIYSYPSLGSHEQEFAERYRERFNISVSPSAAYAYDAVMVLASVLEEHNDPQSVSNYLHNHSWDGVTNNIVFDSAGRVREKPYTLKNVVNGSFHNLS